MPFYHSEWIVPYRSNVLAFSLPLDFFTFLIIQVMFKASHLEWRLQKRQQPQHCQTPHSGKPRRPEFAQEDADSHSDVGVFAPLLNAGKASRAVFAMIRVLRPAIKEHGSVANRWRQRTRHVGVLVDPLTLGNHASIRLACVVWV
jgi:hypothetical protein